MECWITACGSAAGPGTASTSLGSYGPDPEPVSPGRSKRFHMVALGTTWSDLVKIIIFFVSRTYRVILSVFYYNANVALRKGLS